ncbi:MAG: tetratricopeptide repeat-containing sulfotransferase family protein [Woeseiaceae bacterium]
MSEIRRLSETARGAWAKMEWATVDACAAEILHRDPRNAEGHFLSGLVCKAARKPKMSVQAFETALALDPSRYDAAIELASQYSTSRRNDDVAELIARYEGSLRNSPRYLDLAGTVYTEIGLPERAWPLYCQANALQPGIDLFMANKASCAVYLGRIDEARELYEALLKRNPNHQRNHYYLARLDRATDDLHVNEMKAVLQRARLPEDRNVFLYYAIGKELEDLGLWAEAFDYYKRAGDAVTSVAKYDPEDDLATIGSIEKHCTKAWLQAGGVKDAGIYPPVTPVFIVGLPRTGTTLVERIISSHSLVRSLGETQFMQMIIRRESGVSTVEPMNEQIVTAASAVDISTIGQGYLDAIGYRLGNEPVFIDKLPFNFLFLGFIAKAYPHARIVHLRRHPMDTCFAMYKQVFTWAYKFSYSLENLGKYYVAHDRLHRHWREVLGGRMIEVEYETLVANQEAETRRLLDELGLDFEDACLDFEQNMAATTTASSVQVREKMHSRSVSRWKHFAAQLEPLRAYLAEHGIDVG